MGPGPRGITLVSRRDLYAVGSKLSALDAAVWAATGSGHSVDTAYYVLWGLVMAFQATQLKPGTRATTLALSC
jgi:hypothetical protein